MVFENALIEIVKRFRSSKPAFVKIIGNLDADGITATAIIARALQREGIEFSASIIRQIDDSLISEWKRESYGTYVFVDLGSGALEKLEALKDKDIYVLDHHKPEKDKTILNHFNPHLFGIDGTLEISAAGVAYLFARMLNPMNIDLAHLAIIGAIGDIQERNGFMGLNREILDDAVKSGMLMIKKGLRMFGLQTKSLCRVLEYSTNPYIPGVTGSLEGAVSFLRNIGIEPCLEDGSFKRINNLTDEEVKKLITAIILRRMGSEAEPDNIFGDLYIIRGEPNGSPTKDAREFSTLLNCCGRLNRPSLGLGTCLQDKKSKKEAIELMRQYRKEIVNSLEWFYNSKSKGKIKEGKSYVIINAEDAVRDTLIGTLASIISKSNLYADGTVLISLAHTLGDETKVSARISGHKMFDVDLRDIIKRILERIQAGSGGGHKLAAGALIPREKEYAFIRAAEDVLNRIVLEEKVA